MFSIFKRAHAALSRVAEVGWIIDAEKAGFIWAEPTRVRTEESDQTHAKSLRVCPAMLDHEARLFEVACPIDLRVKLAKDAKGQLTLVNMAGDQSSVRSKHLGQMLVLVPQKEWRKKDRPVIQIITPYLFLADEPIYMTQMPPINYYNPNPLPGVLVGGRFPIDVWPRHLMWAMEWHDTSRELVLKRGEPWFMPALRRKTRRGPSSLWKRR
ncbi:MAG: hypothetical protein NWR47_05920 [Aestuariivirgaceae bacterium]|nr:hypothetical protein [Aestuariivirgaceae bacterium]